MVIRYDSLTSRIVGKILLKSEIFSLWFYRSKYVTRIRIINAKSLIDNGGRTIVKNQREAFVNLFFGRIYLDLRNAHDRIVYNEITNRGYYEKGTTILFQKTIKRGNSVLDIGASNGYYTLLFSYLVGNSGSVYSYEPQTQAFNRMLKNLSKNEIKNVKAYKLAIGEAKDEMDLHLSDVEDGGSSLVSLENSIGTEKVRVVTLDSLIAEIRADVLKLDVEGWEINILKGGKKFINVNKPKIILEYNLGLQILAGFRPRNLFDLLANIGYNTYEIKDDGTLSEKITMPSSLSSPLVNLFCVPSAEAESINLNKS